jgi:hypothetical protein
MAGINDLITNIRTCPKKGTHKTVSRDDGDATLVETKVQTLEAPDGLDLRVGQ